MGRIFRAALRVCAARSVGAPARLVTGPVASHRTTQRMLKPTLLFTPLFALLFATTSAYAAETFKFEDKNGRNTLLMELDAPIESIHAVANGIDGTVTIDGDKASGTFKVRDDSIKTGNDSRDGHLQNEKWLEAMKWPNLYFSFKYVVLPSSFKEGKTTTVKAKGEFFVHGVKKTQDVDVKLDYVKESEMTKKRAPGNLIRVRSEFEIKLADYGV